MWDQVSKRWDQGSEGWDLGSQALGSGITSHGIRISSFLREQGVGCIIFVGSGTKICHAVGTKDRKFGYKNGISDQKKKTFLRDQGPNFVKRHAFGFKDRDLGTKMGSVLKKHIYLVITPQYAVNQLKCFRKDHPKGLLIYFWS